MTLLVLFRSHLPLAILASGVLALSSASRPSAAESSDVPSLPAEAQSQFERLSPEAQRVARDQLSRIANFDAMRTTLDDTGHFFIAEDRRGRAADFEEPVLEEEPDVEPMSLMSLSGVGPTGFTPEGVPIFHSLPGSSKVIYLNFIGGTISNTAWNNGTDMAVLDTLPYMLDADKAFSSTEQTMMSNIWRRIAEDYAPWQVDVTTERPAVFTSTTLHAMITKHVTSTGAPMPASGAGGVAYVDVYGNSSLAFYSPALVYYDNLAGGNEGVVTEATAHEIGHNLALSHDGVSGGPSYYSGAGSGVISWGPIMGASYGRAITKFNNGDYANANNREDDLAIITGRLGLRNDDVPNTTAAAAAIVKNNGAFSHSGLMESYSDVDMYSIDAVSALSVTVQPFTSSMNTTGNNVDLAVELLNSAGTSVALSSPNDSSAASITATNLAVGKYYVKVYPVGNPVTPVSVYGSMGQYELLGTYTEGGGVETVLLEATMETFPAGWRVNVQGTWAQGVPTSTSDPKGFPVIGNVLDGTGLYPEPITKNQQLNSKRFSTVGFTSVNVSFDRFLGIAADDGVAVKVCDGGSSCATLWKNSQAVTDTSWSRQTYEFPASMLNKPSVYVRFVLGQVVKPATGSSTSFGWNIKQFSVKGVK